jgi:hypothetical protein
MARLLRYVVAATALLAFVFVPSAVASTMPTGLWDTSVTPSCIAITGDPCGVSDYAGVELGVKFQTSEPIYVEGVRFYTGDAAWSGSVSLWDASGTLLAHKADSTTGKGWQTVMFDSPVEMSTADTFVASYYAPGGAYAFDHNYFTNGSYTNGAVTALGGAGVDGVYAYTNISAFPTEVFDDTNYWVTPLWVPQDTQGPFTSNVVATPNPVAISGQTTLTASVDDSTTGGSDIGSAAYCVSADENPCTPSTSMSASDGAFDSVSEDVTASFAAPSTPGIYDVCVSGTDVIPNTGDAACALLVVYDPSAGFVTGGGWINSPAGAYMADTNLTGKATFGFVSKYKKGATVPSGSTEFQFKVSNLNFHSDTQDWLVVNQNSTNAQFKGSGTINGAGNYGFMIWATDGSPDMFRIQIWDANNNDATVYDNGTMQAIDGGSIIVHK